MKQPLSTKHTGVPVTRVTTQTLQTLSFIHRFRHVTARHLQCSLQHATVTTTHNQLALLRSKGYIDRLYTAQDRAVNRPASYYLTLEGLVLLRARYPGTRFRSTRSIRADANLSTPSRERYHCLADVYVHFKRHHNGTFIFQTASDLSGNDTVPEEIPDGYIHMNVPGKRLPGYFVEIQSWGRSTQQQYKRLVSYLDFAENATMHRSVAPDLLVVVRSAPSQKRITAQLRRMLDQAYFVRSHIYTAVANNLDSGSMDIWHLTPDTVADEPAAGGDQTAIGYNFAIINP